MTPNQSESLKQQYERNEAEIARGEREYAASMDQEGDGFVPAHDSECCECDECRLS